MPVEDYDLAGFAVGIVDKKKMVDNKRMKAGDVVIGLASTGIHSNGFSLCRKVFDIDNNNPEIYVEREELGGKSIAETLPLEEMRKLQSEKLVKQVQGVVLVHEDGQLHLGAAAVGAGNQHGLFHACHRQTEAAAEAAHVVQAALVAGAGNVSLHQFNCLITSSDIHACCGVALRSGMLHNKLPPFQNPSYIVLTVCVYSSYFSPVQQ